MKKYFIFLAFLLLNSCQYIDKQVPSERELLQKELKSINWKEVDEFPTVADCETIADKKERQKCFFDTMSQLIDQRINVDSLSAEYPKVDTIEVKVTVLPNSKIKFEPHFSNTTAYDTIKTDSVLQARLIDFPKVNPAIKRGVPVKTQFILPVVIKAKTKK